MYKRQLFNDVYNQKKKTNCNEVQRVPRNAVRCPYCRITHKNFLLPLLCPPVFGVNFYDPNLDMEMIMHRCQKIEKCESDQNCKNNYGTYLGNINLCLRHLQQKVNAHLNEMEKEYTSFQKMRLKEIKHKASNQCQIILKSGKRKGLSCARVCLGTKLECSIHIPKKKNLEV